MRLQLTRRGDYAVRAMFALSDLPPGEVRSARALAEEVTIPARFVTEVLGDLARAELVQARPGRTGGYRLARPADTIALLEIIEAVEGDSRTTNCVLRDGACRSADGDQCAVHDIFVAAHEALLSELRGARLSELGPKQTGRQAPPSGAGLAGAEGFEPSIS